MKLAQPRGIADIGLAPGHVLAYRALTRITSNQCCSRIRKPDPIDPDGLHRDARHEARFEQSATSRRCRVNVPKERTGMSVQRGSPQRCASDVDGGGPDVDRLWRDNQDESGASIKMRQSGRVRR